jgi:hypothetical protein
VRNARAISSVVSPHTSRSVSAAQASGASAGWQQVKMSLSRSSGGSSSTPVPVEAFIAVQRVGDVIAATRRSATRPLGISLSVRSTMTGSFVFTQSSDSRKSFAGTASIASPTVFAG